MAFSAVDVDRHPLAGLGTPPDLMAALSLPLEFIPGRTQQPANLAGVRPHNALAGSRSIHPELGEAVALHQRDEHAIGKMPRWLGHIRAYLDSSGKGMVEIVGLEGDADSRHLLDQGDDDASFRVGRAAERISTNHRPAVRSSRRTREVLIG